MARSNRLPDEATGTTEPRSGPAFLEIDRSFEAPRELVFRAWSELEHRLGWWGPQGHALAEHSIDFRPGGRWSTTIVNPDGTRAEMHGVFTEIVPPRRLSFTYVFEEIGIDSVVEIDLAEHGDGTRMRFRQGPFPSREALEGHNWGWTSSLGQLQAQLLAMLAGQQPRQRHYDGVAADFMAARERAAGQGPDAGDVLELERRFDAPPALVFRMWSDPEHIVRWYGPEGHALTTCEQDFRVGGAWRRCMSRGPGHEHWISGVFTEIDPPGRLGFTYVNAHDGIETQVSMRFVAEGGGTRMFFRQTGFVQLGERDGHGWGWGSTFELLNRYLANLHGLEDRPFGLPRRDGVAEDIRAARQRQEQQAQQAQGGRPRADPVVDR